MYEGVMATTATRLKDREKHQTSSLISGGLDVAFGAWGLWRAIRVAKKATAAAKVSWHKMVKDSIGKMKDATVPRNASRNVSSEAIEASSDLPRTGSVRSTRSETAAREVSPMANPSVAGPSGSSGQTAGSSAPPEPVIDYSPPTPPPKPKKPAGGSVNPDGKWATTTEVRNNKLNDISVGQRPEYTVAQIRSKIGSHIKN